VSCSGLSRLGNASMKKKVNFDGYADNYDDCLNKQLGISGEDSEYFDCYKVNCLNEFCVQGAKGLDILDYGCGIGKLSFLFARNLPDSEVTGFDISNACIDNAEKQNTFQNLSFTIDATSLQKYDYIIVSNVFHHITPEKRVNVLKQLRTHLKERGQIVIFEHNPFNPVTRYAVKNCDFDEDAVLITLREFIQLGKKANLQVFDKRYIVFFPSFLSALRPLEKRLGFCPFGAQYMLSFSV